MTHYALCEIKTQDYQRIGRSEYQYEISISKYVSRIDALSRHTVDSTQDIL
jgi:hypothetical protein